MINTEIRQIDLLVHPDYNILRYNPLSTRWPPLHPFNHHLQFNWEQRVRNLDPDTVMFYFSSLKPDQFRKALKNPDRLRSGVLRWEIDRIAHFQEILGDRFFVFDSRYLPAGTEVQKLFEERGFLYHTDRLQLYAYGEIREACVIYWGEELQQQLGIPKGNLKVDTEDFSLSSTMFEMISSWRENLDRSYNPRG